MRNIDDRGRSISSFEHFSLRVARLMLMISIGLGCTAIVAGLVVAGGAWLLPGPPLAAKSDPPSPKKFALHMAEKWAAEHVPEGQQIERAILNVDEPALMPPALAALFPSPQYATSDVWEEYCKTLTDYGCVQKGKRLTKPAAGRLFTFLFRGVEASLADEFVGVLSRELPAVSVEKRLGMVRPVLASYLDVRKENQDGEAAYEAGRSEAEATYQTAKKDHSTSQVGWSIGGLYAAAWGLACVLSASVFVALLAIERHLRALRDRTASVPDQSTEPS